MSVLQAIVDKNQENARNPGFFLGKYKCIYIDYGGNNSERFSRLLQ
jgi:hypothetical protein